MSERNKGFRNHCNIDVLLDTENRRVSVSVAYKPDLLASDEKHKYGCQDVIEELARRGLSVDKVEAGTHIVLDNTSIGSRHPQIQGDFQFLMVLADKTSAAPPKKLSKRRAAVKSSPKNK